jgi:hypothetical protein
MAKFLKFILFLVIFHFIISLHFDLSVENKRCYYEELFDHSVAVIKYKIWTSPNNLEKCNMNLIISEGIAQ